VGKLVGVAGFEPATPTSRTLCSIDQSLKDQRFLFTFIEDWRGLFTVNLSRSCPGDIATARATSTWKSGW